MGERKKMKKYVLISGFNLRDNNRGTAALGYGSISFCDHHGYLKDTQELINFIYVKKFWKKEYRDRHSEYSVDGKRWRHHVVFILEWEKKLYDKFHILLPFTKFGKYVRNIDLVATINGGDGFSDIYNDSTFYHRLTDTEIAMRENIPVIVLPQTLGPFEKQYNFNIAKSILQYASAVYVRDDKFNNELEAMNVKYKLTKDLSAYMQPEPFDISIVPDSIGINVSGLAYSNGFRTLSGQFTAYPELIDRLICHFRDNGHTVYLIPHSYNYSCPEPNNDDLVACKEAYKRLKNKENIVLVDYDLLAPQIKYVISKMKFFIGTRMHANFAAIYTGVPLFGLAYSYKFEGAFNANGLNGNKQTTMINNIRTEDIDNIIEKIDCTFQEYISNSNHE